MNVSEGRAGVVLDAVAGAGGGDLLDLHRDEHHHRSVLTLAGEDAVQRVAAAAVAGIDLRRHSGVHPRLGAVDVVPFVPYGDATPADAVGARDRFARFAGTSLGLPVFVYGDEGPTLPAVRRRAFRDLHPVAGPALPHPTAGAVAVAARSALVAYNVWLADADLAVARRVAAAVRAPALRALGLPVGGRCQISMNLVAPDVVGPAEAFDAVAALAPVDGAELVGLLPERILARTPPERWEQLDLADDRTVEARLSRRAAVGGPAHP